MHVKNSLAQVKDQYYLSVFCVKLGEKISTNVTPLGVNLPIDLILCESNLIFIKIFFLFNVINHLQRYVLYRSFSMFQDAFQVSKKYAWRDKNVSNILLDIAVIFYGMKI